MTGSTRRDLLTHGLAAAGGWAALGGDGHASSAARANGVEREHTRFAVNVELWWTALPFLDRLRAAADSGFPAVEFWPWRGKDLDAIANLTDELGLEVAQFTAWGFSPGLNDPANHAAFTAEIEAGCRAARTLGAAHMTVVGGDDRPGVARAELHAAIAAGLALAAPIAAEHGVCLILEPMNVRVDHPGHSLWGSTDALAICRALDSPHVKLNWDLYHMQISEGDLCGRLREGFDQVGYLQLADHPGRHEPGTGEIHYPRVLKEAWELGYRGYVGLECRPQHSEDLAARRCFEAATWS